MRRREQADAIHTKRGESVADGLLRLGRDGVDDLPEFLEGDPLIGMRLKGFFEVWLPAQEFAVRF